MLRYLIHPLLLLCVCSLSWTLTQAQPTVPESDTLRLNRNGREKAFHYLTFYEEGGPILGNGTAEAAQLIDQSTYRAHSVMVGWQIPKSDIYSRLYRFPKFGVGVYSSNFRNLDIGFPRAYYLWFEIPFSYPRFRQRWSWAYRGGFGIANDFVPFDEDANPLNELVGSTQNCFVDIAFLARYHLNSRFLLGLSAGFKHFSNGSSRLPNYGINMFPAALSVHYLIDEQRPDFSQFEPLPRYQPHYRINVNAAVGQKQYSRETGYYTKSTLGVNVLRQFSYKYRMGVGLDFMYAGGYRERQNVTDPPLRDVLSMAVVGSWEWVIRPRIYIPVGLGFYLNRNPLNDDNNWYYERVGVRYAATEHLFVGLTIKAHKGNADYFEWGMGYTFHNDTNDIRRKRIRQVD
ncbi:hypothetical protein [Spirosoma montaniterrae]|uniref:Deacylase n=1 Tax=Spirosoma montaniterrae TaxID=1178516 RepID=A0A1P9X2X3_9BACT|nr:hypothetical protein [Spirosoma montaniterrae]AQG81982.1 hypothetical protein AWR27_23400 [Spirosoma montaniterrae]